MQVNFTAVFAIAGKWSILQCMQTFASAYLPKAKHALIIVHPVLLIFPQPVSDTDKASALSCCAYGSVPPARGTSSIMLRKALPK